MAKRGLAVRTVGVSPASSFIGRVAELEEVSDALLSNRLLTLTGAVGCGKSRLARRYAEDHRADYPDGVYVVDLAFAQPDAVLGSIATTMNMRSVASSGSADSLADLLGASKLLVVLDNCEHVSDACAELCDTLLRRCPFMSILVTSREPLVLAGEAIWQVNPLALPPPATADLAGLMSYESSALFVTRARESYRRFKVTGRSGLAVTRICRELDGIPLAIELAAGRTISMEVEEISERLGRSLALLAGGARSARGRHRTVEAAITWSYDLLDERSRALFARTSVFGGAFSLAALEAVCADEDLPIDLTLDALHALVTRSMIQTEEDTWGNRRYRLLGPLRQFAAQQVSADSMASLRCRHFRYFLDFAESLQITTVCDSTVRSVRQFEADRENFRSALDWSGIHDPPRFDRLVELLADLWVRVSQPVEAAAYVRAAIRWRKSEGRSAADYDVLLAVLEGRAGDYESALRRASLALVSIQDDQHALLARCHLVAAICEAEVGDLGRARQQALASIDLERLRCDRSRLATALNDLAIIEISAGEPGEAFAALSEADHCRAAGAESSPTSSHTRAMALIVAGRLSEASGQLIALLRRGLDDDMPEIVSQALDGLGIIACGQQKFVAAARLLAAAERERVRAGAGRDFLSRAFVMHGSEEAATQLGPEAYETARLEGMRTPAADFLAAFTAEIEEADAAGKPESGPKLTRREQQCVELVRKGLSNKEIAAVMGISVRTVTTHLERIRRKYALHNRVEISRLAESQSDT